MQGVYYRTHARSWWTLLARTKSVGHAERVMRRKALRCKRGELLYLETPLLLLTARKLRSMGKVRILAHRTVLEFLSNAHRETIVKTKRV